MSYDNWKAHNQDDEQMGPEPGYDEEWCLRAAEREGDSEIGAGALARDPLPTWFWYGRFEGACGGYAPPDDGVLSRLQYAAGNIVGRVFGASKR